MLLLREAAEGSEMLRRFARCFVDHRNPELIEHTVEDPFGSHPFAYAPGAILPSHVSPAVRDHTA